MIEGNWAMGRPVIETRPRIAGTTEMTMATMGRSMKKRDIPGQRAGVALAASLAWGARPEDVVGVRKDPLDRHRTRPRVHLTVREDRLTLMGKDASVVQDEVEHGPLPSGRVIGTVDALREAHVLALADAVVDADRIDG